MATGKNQRIRIRLQAYEHRILDGEPATAAARVALTKATKDVIKTGLWLIGIEAPERM